MAIEKTIGTDVGDDYTTIRSALSFLQSSSPLDSDYDFILTTTVSETMTATIYSIGLNGHTVRFYNQSPHAGVIGAGNLVNVVAPDAFGIRYSVAVNITSSGTFKMYGYQFVYSGNNQSYGIYVNGNGSDDAPVITFNNNIIDGNYKIHTGILLRVQENESDIQCHSNLIMDVRQNCILVRVSDGTGGTNDVYAQNNTCYNSGEHGIRIIDGNNSNNNNLYVYNNLMFDTTLSCLNQSVTYSSVSVKNNAVDDTSLPYGNGNIENIVPGTELITLDDTNSKYLVPKITGKLKNAGTTDISTENDKTIDDKNRPDVAGYVTIGAYKHQELDYTAPDYVILRNDVESIGFNPKYTNNIGSASQVDALGNPAYIVQQRNYKSSTHTYSVVNSSKTAANLIEAAWREKFEHGALNMTVVDHRKRFLFEAGWEKYKQRWKMMRGGVFDIKIDLESPVSWTPPCFAFYGMVFGDMSCHSGDPYATISLSDGTMVDYSTDTNILRKNGYALKLADDAGTAQSGASSTALTWEVGKDNGSFSMFCQASIPEQNAGNDIDILRITDGAGVYAIRASNYNASTGTMQIEAVWQESGESEESISITDLSTISASSPSLPQWYDIAFVYDGVGNKFFLYVWESAAGSYWSKTNMYLDGETTISDRLASQESPTNYPDLRTFTELYMLDCAAADTFVDDAEYAYLQNVFVIDEYISPQYFNVLRRLCYLWNNKSTGTHPE